jgi:hypothetical protein
VLTSACQAKTGSVDALAARTLARRSDHPTGRGEAVIASSARTGPTTTWPSLDARTVGTSASGAACRLTPAALVGLSWLDASS